MATTAAPSASPPPPSQWPKAVVSQYEPVRALGKGGFASVMLARHTNTGEVAAIKVAKNLCKQDYGYAHREIDILQELSHPNIMKVLQSWEGQDCVVMALSYARGPTLQNLIQFGGAVNLTFGRIVISQLIDALAYCHGRAVIHRDIKPDNVIVTGASASQDNIWQNDDTTTTVDWKQLRQKWHVTLVDFGFARALSPQDFEKETVTMKSSSSPQKSQQGSSVDGSGSRHSSRSWRNLNQSVSHALKRNMSALGNRHYAAPEIIQGVQQGSRHSLTASITTSGGVDITKTLSSHVANYGMLADAFSLGQTLQYTLTGVPPQQNVTETLDSMNSPLVKLGQCISQHLCGSSKSDNKRDYQYRGWKDLPEEVVRLIHGLSNPSVSKRTSVRAARRYLWIETVLEEEDLDPNVSRILTMGNNEEEHRVHFLKCTLGKQQQQQSGSSTKATTATLANGVSSSDAAVAMPINKEEDEEQEQPTP